VVVAVVAEVVVVAAAVAVAVGILVEVDMEEVETEIAGNCDYWDLLCLVYFLRAIPLRPLL
jgi:hypothetical protein